MCPEDSPSPEKYHRTHLPPVRIRVWSYGAMVRVNRARVRVEG